ncbi:MAG TPA: sigma-70 family RNA polymerase sigma factor, partial [Xylella fastidiosa subsp. multiplex]
EAEIEEAEQFNHSSHLSDTNTPERELMRQELEQIVMSAVQALPEEFRTAFTLCEMEGLSYQEIAQRMDCQIGTVRTRIFRAREAIDIELRPFLEINNITRKRYRV